MKRLPAAFYQSSSGREPVREWLKALAIGDRKIIGEDIKDVEFSWPIGMPLCRALGDLGAFIEHGAAILRLEADQLLAICIAHRRTLQ